jgi:peptidoglycan/xylan/chitin deacetylase (PgdA/CDA1 family)
VARPLKICLTFDFDAMSVWLATFKKTGPQAVSRGEFGARVGVPRILDLLDRFDASATFFTPGHTALTYPDVVREIHARGHEIGSHGQFHENFEHLTLEEETRVFVRSREILRDLTGYDPIGLRCPAGDFSENTVQLLNDFGYRYDSSLAGDDFTPYRCRTGDSWTPDGPYVFGEETDVLEFPVGFLMDDFPYFEFDYTAQISGDAEPEKIRRIWQAEFDYMREHVPHGVFTIAMHPQCIGHGSRIAMLERLLVHMRDCGGTFVSMRDVAAEWSARLTSSTAPANGKGPTAST